MLIDKEYLKTLNPCEDRYKNYLEHYNDWKGSLEEFLDLEKITYSDKKWVYFKSIPKNHLKLMAADFAERLLYIYENKYPNDDRPRKAIEAARNGGAADSANDAADPYAAVYTARAATDPYVAGTSCSEEIKTQLEIMKKYAREQIENNKEKK